MAWRIQDQIASGFIDNRIKGRVTGKIWLAGRKTPLELDLEGNALADMAGCRLTFKNPAPLVQGCQSLFQAQEGHCGEMTASRKVRIPSSTTEPDHAPDPASKPTPDYQWSNLLYLEWFSEANGRVIIESTDFEMQLSPPEWRLTPDEVSRQMEQNEERLRQFLQKIIHVLETLEEGEGEAEQENTSLPASPEATDHAVDQLLRVTDLKYAAEQQLGNDLTFPEVETLPLHFKELFWKHLLEIGEPPLMTRRELLISSGLVPRSTGDIHESEIHEALWDLIGALASHAVYLDFTDHLSDRQLYDLLVHETLEEKVPVFPGADAYPTHILMHEYGGLNNEDGFELFLRYYADEEFRQLWQADFPEESLPPAEEPPFDRDQFLPHHKNEDEDSPFTELG